MSKKLIEHIIEPGAVVVVNELTTVTKERALAQAWSFQGGVRVMVSSHETGHSVGDHNARYIDLSKEQAIHLAAMIQRAAEE